MKANLNHIHALYATQIVLLCPENAKSSLALSKDTSSHFCLAVTYIFCNWLSIITSITFYIIQRNNLLTNTSKGCRINESPLGIITRSVLQSESSFFTSLTKCPWKLSSVPAWLVLAHLFHPFNLFHTLDMNSSRKFNTLKEQFSF